MFTYTKGADEMMIINNQEVYSDEELADQAFRRYVNENPDYLEYTSFVEGYLTALRDMK